MMKRSSPAHLPALGFIAVVLALAALPATAAEPVNQTRDGVAIDGYDPVAYFEEGAAVSGDPHITHEWQGAVWRFSDPKHREQFAAEPERYVPRYGGYCAFAVSKGSIAKVDPEAWTIHEGALYLNYSLGVRKRWRRDIPGNIAKADAHWPQVLDE